MGWRFFNTHVFVRRTSDLRRSVFTAIASNGTSVFLHAEFRASVELDVICTDVRSWDFGSSLLKPLGGDLSVIIHGANTHADARLPNISHDKLKSSTQPAKKPHRYNGQRQASLPLSTVIDFATSTDKHHR